MLIAQSMSWKKERLTSDVVKEQILEASGSEAHENTNIDPVTDDMPSEPMAFLQGLHSGNLMQFSQQSAYIIRNILSVHREILITKNQSLLREMMLQDIETQINSLPKLENHNNGDYCFGMVLEEPPKSHWMFSIPLNKLYIRMNKTFNIDVKFKAKLPIQPLNLRAFLCFVKDVSGPVLRCQNHLSTDNIRDNSTMRESLLRCENPNSLYSGTSQGKSIAERYSVLVPLNVSRTSQKNSGFIRQTLAFSFACQNSCFGRKETCLVFCLEHANGDILGQQVLYLKICTCPKRDRNQDERNMENNKRKTLSGVSEDDEDDVGNTKKMRRRTRQHEVKEENESNDSFTVQPVPNDWEVSRSVDGEYRLVIKCSKKEILLQHIEGMIEKTAAAVLRDTENSKLRQHAKNLLNLKKYAEKLS